MAEPKPTPDATPAIPEAPDYVYPAPPAPPVAPPPPPPPPPAGAAGPLEPPRYGERLPGYVPPPPAPAPQGPPPPGYAPGPYGSPAPGYGYGYGYPMAPAAPRRRRGWDVGLTVTLLALGFVGMLAGLGSAPMFADPTFGAQLADVFGGDSIDFGAFPVILAVSHVVLYLVALGASIPLLVSGRAVAFWIPLAAGVLAAAVFWGGYLGVVFAQIDPTQVPGL